MLIKTIEEGVNKLLLESNISGIGDWRYIAGGEDDFTDFLKYNGQTIPLMYWRFDQRYSRMQARAQSIIGEVCSLKTSWYCARDIGLKRLMYSEIALSHWLLSSKTAYLTAFINGSAANCIFMMENQTVATLELASTLAEGTAAQGKHTVFATGGMVSDRVVANKVTPSAVYMYTDSVNPQTFDDVSLRLYGLSKTEVEKVSCIYDILTNKKSGFTGWTEEDKRVQELVKMCFESSKKGERIYAGGANL